MSNFHPPKTGARFVFPEVMHLQFSPPGWIKSYSQFLKVLTWAHHFGDAQPYTLTLHLWNPSFHSLWKLEGVKDSMKYKVWLRFISSLLIAVYPPAECALQGASQRAWRLWGVPLFCYWLGLRLFIADVHLKSAGLCVLQETRRWHGWRCSLIPPASERYQKY